MVPPEVQEELAQLRSRVAEGEEWQRKREAEVELLRNALQRRDALLVSQRTSFYRELLSHQDYANIASVGSMQPSVTLDEMHRLERFATITIEGRFRPESNQRPMEIRRGEKAFSAKKPFAASDDVSPDLDPSSLPVNPQLIEEKVDLNAQDSDGWTVTDARLLVL